MSDAATAVTDRDVRCRHALRLLLGTGMLAAIWWVLMTGTAHAATPSQERGDSVSLGRSVSHVAHDVAHRAVAHQVADDRAPGGAQAHPVRRAARPAIRPAIRTVTHTVTGTVTGTTRAVTKAVEPVVQPVVKQVVEPVVRPVTEPVVEAIAEPVVTTLAVASTSPRSGPDASGAATQRGSTEVTGGGVSGSGRTTATAVVTSPASSDRAVPATPEQPAPAGPGPADPTPDLGSGFAAASAVLVDAGDAPVPSRGTRPLHVTLLRPLERAYPPGSSPD